MSASYNDWESDLSSIIEKTNQNLKLLRRIGEKRTDDVSTTRSSSMSMGNASDLRTAVHHRYAAEDAASYRPRVMSSASSSGRKHATTMGDPRLGGGNAGGVGLRASMMLDSRRGEANYDSDDLHSSSRTLRRSASRTDGSKTLKSTSAATIRVHEADMPSDIPNYVLDEIKKSLEVNISSRSSVFEKRIGDLRTDFTVLTNETTQLSHKFAELRDSVMAKMSNVPGVLQSLQENTDAITRLEKHSSALLGWKVSMDQDFFEIASKVKNFASLQGKMATLESNLESLATALRNRPRHDEKIEELRDKLATVERHQSSFVDMKAVENLLNIRLPREFHELEGRMSQSIAFVSEKVEAKIQNLEKSLQSQRADSMASLKSELIEDIQRLSATSLRKTDITPLQNAQGQLKEDLLQLNGFLDRQDKRIQDFKQSSTQIREELLETKQELTKALHAQQGRVTATLEEKITQLSIMSKEKNVKMDQQMAILSKKQKKVEENTKTLHEDIAKVRQDVLYKQNASHVAQQKENEKLRQRLARSIAELETLTLAKVELEHRYGKQEKQFQAKLKALHAKLEESEKLKESERLELVQKIQEETKLMGIAQGKNALLETLLVKEKLQNAEKNDLIHKSRQEMNLVRQKMRTFEAEVEVKMHKLATELHSKEVQIETLVKKLKKSEEEAAKLLETTKRDAKSFRRAKVTKEHELSIAKLKLKGMEKAASAMATSQSNGVKEASKQAPDASKKSVEEAEAKRKEMEQLLLDSQLQVDELNQEIDEMRKEHDAMKKQQRTSLEEHVSKLSSDYEVKILALNAAVAAKDQTMSRLRDSLVERSELDAVDEQLRALKDEKKSLLSTIERSHTEQARIIQEHEAKSQAAHDKEMDAMKRSLETRLGEIEEARAGFGRFKANIAKLEDQLKDQESSHAEDLASLMDEIKEARASIAACTAEVEELRVEKLRLEHELESVQSKLENLRSGADERDVEMDEKLAEQEIEMQSKLDELSSQLEEKERELADSKQADERNRRTLSEMVSEQEQMERHLRTEIDSLSLALEHERENSKTREQESESTILALQSELDMIKLDSHAAKTSYQSTVVAEIAELTGSLKESQRREEQLQERLVSILKEVAQASSTFNADTQIDITGNEDDDALAVKYLGHFCATQRGTVMELENLQADYEMAVKQAAQDAAAIQDLDAQTKVYSTQIQNLQAVVKQLESELKEQYATSAKQSEDLEQEIGTLRKQKSDLERIVEIKSNECDEKQALFDRQLESKQEQVEILRQENEKMSATMGSIRVKMESIEASKARELDEMSAALAELEARASSHTVKAQDSVASELDKDFYANHHETLALAQSIRSLQLKLTKSVGVMEWNDLKASVFEEEDKLERLRKEKNREVTKLRSAEDEVLLNADFLKAVLSLRDSKGSDASDDWTSKYVKTAPEIVEKLRNLESRLQEAMAKHHTQTLATENRLSQRDGTKMERSAPDSPMQIDTSDETRPQKERRDLSESCESDELLEESQEVLERDDDFDEQSFEGSLDESGILSDSAALNESSLDLSARENGLEASLHHTGGETPSRSLLEDRRSTDDRRERVDPCTTLLLANTLSELLSTSSVRSPIRQSEPAMSSLGSESREDSELNSRADDELDESHEDTGTSGNSESVDVSSSSTSHLREQFADDAGASSHLASGCGDGKERIRHNDNTDLSSMADPIHSDNASDSNIDEASVGSDAVGDDLHEEVDDAEHSFDSPQNAIHHDGDRSPVATTSTQGLSTESSVMPSHTSNSEPVKAASPDLQEHEQTRDGFAGGKRGTQVGFEGDEDCDIDSEEELDESQDEKPISECEVHAESREPHMLLEENSKPTSDFDEPDDYVEQSEGDESADLEGYSHKPASADSDFRMENVERTDGVLSPGLHQSQYDDDNDQGFHRVDTEHGSGMEEEDSKASAFKPKHLVQDDFEGTVRDPSFHDASFDSHESDEENLSEFEHFQREQTVRNAESTSLNAVTGSSSHDGEEAFATSRPSYRMEEEESEEDDDMDEVKRMLLAESQDSYPHSNVKRHNEEGRHGGSADDDEDELDDSAEVERPDMAESSFDDDVDPPSIKLPPRGDDLDLKQGTHESLKRELSADGSMQSGMGKALRDGNHREYSRDIDDDDKDLMDESVEDEPTQPGLGELKLGDSHEGGIKTRGLMVDTTRGDDTIQQRGLNRRVSENVTEENDESDNENSPDEDQFESSFDQVPSATVDNAGDDQKNSQDIANDSSVPAAASSSLSGRSALSKHMSFSRSQVDDGDEDEVGQLMREQSGFASHRPNALTGKSSGREGHRQDDEVEEQDDDELIDSESGEGEELSFDGSADDEGKLGANYHNADSRPQEASPYEDGAIAGDLHFMSRTETSLDTMARTADVRHDQRLGDSHDDLEDGHEDSDRHSDGGTISDSSEGDSAEHRDATEEEDSVNGDGEIVSALGELSKAKKTLEESMQSHDENEQDTVDQSNPKPSVRNDQEESSNEEDEFKFGSRRMEPSLPAAPVKLQSSQLAPLAAPSSRLGGAGALKKALNAASRTFDEDDDDDMDEVERLMLEQSLARASKPISSTQSSAKFAKKDDSENEDEDEFYTGFASVHDHGLEDTDDFEEHELDFSARDDHDESFGSLYAVQRDHLSQANRLSVDRQSNSAGNSFDERSLDDLASTSTGADAFAQVDARREAPTDFKGADAVDGDDESNDEKSSSRSVDREAALRESSYRAYGKERGSVSRRQLGFGLGRRVSLEEEDDDMDEVERLLFEQTSMKQQSAKPTGSHRFETTARTEGHSFGAEGDEDDDEFGEASIEEPMQAYEQSSFGGTKANAVSQKLDVHHNQRLRESNDDEDSEAGQEESVDSSHEQSSFDGAPAEMPTTSASLESSFDEQASKTLNSASHDQHPSSKHRFEDGDAISDSSESDDDETVSSRHLAGSSTNARNAQQHTLAPLGSLGTKSLDVGLGRRGALEEEDDDMDEVERLLLEQTSMKQQQQTSKQASQAASSGRDASESDDDEFGEESIGALMEERDHLQQTRPQASDNSKPFDIVERTQQQQQHRPIDFAQHEGDDDDGGDIDNESDEERLSPLRTESFSNRGDFDQSHSASSSPSASSTRIPIFNGSNLADRVATDAIPSMLSQQTTSTATAVESEIQQQLQHLEHDDVDGEEDEEEEYLEDSFDLEESLQDEEED